MVVAQVFDEKDDIEGINDQYWHLRAEAVPEDQLSVSEQDQLMHVYHFTCDQQSHVSRHALLNYCITSWLSLLCMLFEGGTLPSDERVVMTVAGEQLWRSIPSQGHRHRHACGHPAPDTAEAGYCRR